MIRNKFPQFILFTFILRLWKYGRGRLKFKNIAGYMMVLEIRNTYGSEFCTCLFAGRMAGRSSIGSSDEFQVSKDGM